MDTIKITQDPQPQRTRNSRIFWSSVVGGFLATLGLFFLLGGTPRQAHCQNLPVDSDLIGAHRCRGCHERAYQTWQNSAHAKAYSRLSEQDRKNPTCLSCHTTAKVPHLQGVQCESCHGGGKYYAIPEVMVDGVLARSVGLKVQKGASGCMPCHSVSSTKIRKFHYPSMWKKIAHPSR